jgi:hypothetical protein
MLLYVFEGRNKVARGQMDEITVRSTGCPGGDLFAATTSTAGKARQGKARQLNCNPGPPAKDDLPELAPEDCGHAPGEHSQLHVES